jgi:hypothetical protein
MRVWRVGSGFPKRGQLGRATPLGEGVCVESRGDYDQGEFKESDVGKADQPGFRNGAQAFKRNAKIRPSLITKEM